jgi:hypothetical protein
MPLDVVAVIQPFASMRQVGAALAHREATRLTELVQAEDRLSLIIASAPPVLDRELAYPPVPQYQASRWTGTADVSLWDSLFLAYQQLDRPDRRKVVLLMTNSDNDAGVVGPREVAAIAELRPAQLFVLLVDRTGPDNARLSGRTYGGRTTVTIVPIHLKWGVPSALVDLVQSTGGRIFDLGSEEANLAAVLGYLRAQYLITYTPTGVPRSGWHNVEVRLRGRGGTVVTRPGYWTSPRVPH